MTLPQQLYQDKLCSKPVVFTRNRLVVILPSSNPANIRSVYDLKKNGVKLVIAGAGVPVGSYTLQVLRNMNSTSVLSNSSAAKPTFARCSPKWRSARLTPALPTRPMRRPCRGRFAS